jgi:hypothetical protein
MAAAEEALARVRSEAGLPTNPNTTAPAIIKQTTPTKQRAPPKQLPTTKLTTPQKQLRAAKPATQASPAKQVRTTGPVTPVKQGRPPKQQLPTIKEPLTAAEKALVRVRAEVGLPTTP